MTAAMEIFDLTKSFPAEEKYSMVDQMRRASRSVCTNIGEGWRKQRYKAAFIAKLSDSEGEACEIQILLELAGRCNDMNSATKDALDGSYEQIIKQLVRTIEDADKWLIKAK
jgi:four helix bundle protein